MIAVDWGTSSFRAFRIDARGAVTGHTQSARGILTVQPGGFGAVLREAIEPWLEAGEDRVLMSGMIGSRQGWVEAPYLPCPAGAAEIAAAVVAVPFDGATVRLVPGLTDRDAAGTPEVMRGEETQLLGVLDRIGPDGLACLPGSHSKWARIAGGRIDGFSTYMTGEAFAALRAGTILGRMMNEAPPNAAAFARGIVRSGSAGHLLHQLFGVRTLGLMGELADDDSASYLSGVLIGHELRDALPPGGHAYLIGAPALTELYREAIAQCGGTSTTLSSDAAASGLASIGAQIAWT
jgi:2-dehydro-3-deoxygalactonokinase